MKLGSSSYDEQSDESGDFVTTPTNSFTRGDRIRKEVSNRSKLRKKEEREKLMNRVDKIIENRDKQQKKIKAMNTPSNQITNYLTPGTTSTESSSAANTPSSATSFENTQTTQTLCGYQINPIPSPPSPSQSAVFETNFNRYTQTDPNQLCIGCNSTPSECANLRYGNVCLHGVLDYSETVCKVFTITGIKKAFHDTYLQAARRDMFLLTGSYELSTDLVLPKCLEIGALDQSIMMMKGQQLYEVLMSQRVYDVQNSLKKRKRMRNEPRVKDEIVEDDGSYSG